MYPLIGDVGTPELLIILVVVMLMFGSSKLPDLARGSGRALRIFKEEIGKTDDAADDADEKTSVTPDVEATDKSVLPGRDTAD